MQRRHFLATLMGTGVGMIAVPVLGKETQTTRSTGKPVTAGSSSSGKIEVAPEERQRALAAGKAAAAEEQLVSSRMRGLQALYAREEQLLTQRMEYAAKIRQQGLAKNDEALLKKAEQIERQSLAYYQQRLKQFERISITSSNSRSQQTGPPQRSSSNSPPRSRSFSGRTSGGRQSQRSTYTRSYRRF